MPAFGPSPCRRPKPRWISARSCARTDGRSQLRARGRAGVGSRQALSHRLERSGARAVRPGLPVRIRQPEVRLLAGQVPRGCRLRRPASFRRSRLPDGGLRWRARLRARLHADVSDPAPARASVECGPGHSGAGCRARETGPARARLRASRSVDDGSAARCARRRLMTGDLKGKVAQPFRAAPAVAGRPNRRGAFGAMASLAEARAQHMRAEAEGLRYEWPPLSRTARAFLICAALLTGSVAP